jgi:hypothetical protein
MEKFGEMDQEKQLDWARFRFSVIAPLVCRRLTEDERRALRHDILNQLFITPDGYEKRMAPRTLNDWVFRYRKAGFDGLLASRRKTLGSVRAIPEALLDRAEQLRREEESRSVKMILRILQAEGFDTKGISKTTLNVHLNRRGASRQRLSGAKGGYQRWEQSHANKLWQADTSRGVYLPDPTNPKQLKQTRLISFIDDATRVCTHAEFYWDEKLPSLIDCFRKALLKRGKPEGTLYDNGFIFHSTTMEIMCAQLNIEPHFCEPYSPPSKGKVEKHYSTIKSAFYKEAEHSGMSTLDELNQFFFAWLTKEYHHAKHSALNMTPLERWRQDEQSIKRVTPEEIRRALMLRAERTVNTRTAQIRIDSRWYQASPDLAGTVVEVRWHAGSENEVEVFRDGKAIETAKLTKPQANIDFSRRPQRKEKPRGLTYQSSKRYRQYLVAQCEGEMLLPPQPDEYLAEAEFVKLFTDTLEKTPEPEELCLLSQFFLENSPLKTNLTQSLLAQAVNAKGKCLHLRSYLEHIRTANFHKRR